MKLIEVLSVIPDYANVRVYNSNMDIIARYNGRDSIPNELNNETVSQIRSEADYMENEWGIQRGIVVYLDIILAI